MRKALLLLLFAALLLSQAGSNTIALSTAPSLAERLGFKSTDKILIINVDDVGNSHAANAAVIDAMENGLATSSTIIVPGPWFPEIAAYAKAHRNSDFGVHLAHTSEWKTLKWGPVASKSEVPGLVDPQGYLWPDIASVYKNSTPEQAYIEARAQIKKAIDAGIDVTHVDSHMGTLQYNEAYFQIYRRLAKEFNLPLRMGSQELLAAQGGGHQRGQQLDQTRVRAQARDEDQFVAAPHQRQAHERVGVERPLADRHQRRQDRVAHLDDRLRREKRPPGDVQPGQRVFSEVEP